LAEPMAWLQSNRIHFSNDVPAAAYPNLVF
jgi:hypothetical protein